MIKLSEAGQEALRSLIDDLIEYHDTLPHGSPQRATFAERIARLEKALDASLEMRRLPPLPHKPYPSVEEYRVLATPKPGFWMVRLRRGGPEMPASIVEIDHEPDNPDNKLDTGPILAANVGYEEADPDELWQMRGRPISRQEYEFQMARVAWARAHAPHEPEAAPRKPVDLTALPALGPEE